jgi:hypothetical protein
VHKPGVAGKLGLKQTGPSPVSCSRPPPASHIPGPCTSVPRLLFKYALQARRARLSLQAPFPSELTALPRCFCTILFGPLSYAASFVSAVPAVTVHPRRCCFASGTRISSHACMRAACLRSPTLPRFNTTDAVRPLALLSIQHGHLLSLSHQHRTCIHHRHST